MIFEHHWCWRLYLLLLQVEACESIMLLSFIYPWNIIQLVWEETRSFELNKEWGWSYPVSRAYLSFQFNWIEQHQEIMRIKFTLEHILSSVIISIYCFLIGPGIIAFERRKFDNNWNKMEKKINGVCIAMSIST